MFLVLFLKKNSVIYLVFSLMNLHLSLMFEITKYFKNEQDFLNIIQVNKKYQKLLDLFDYNPIPSIRPFIYLKTQILYDPLDKLLDYVNNYIFDYPITFNSSISLKNNLNSKSKIVNFNKIVLTQKDRHIIDITIPQQVSILGDNCFAEVQLKSIEIKTNIRTIKDQCFYKCTNLKSISIPMTVTFIGEECFKFCNNLIEIFWYDPVEYIGKECFCMCSSLKKIILPTSLTFLPEHSFYRCDNLTEVVVPNGITSIGNGCFDCCYMLRELVFSQNLCSIGDYCFRNCYSLTKLIIPPIKDIGKDCFVGCLNFIKEEFIFN